MVIIAMEKKNECDHNYVSMPEKYVAICKQCDKTFTVWPMKTYSQEEFAKMYPYCKPEECK